jgi:hypothetical protein
MKKTGKNGIKLLKTAHILFSSFWGGAICCRFIGLVLCGNQDDKNIHGILLGLHDFEYILIPCIFGLIGTGLVYSIFTEWGFKKYYWILIKWIMTLAFPFIGAFPLDNALKRLLVFSKEPDFTKNNGGFRDALLHGKIVYGIVVLLFIFIVFIGINKPFGKVKKAQ